MYILKLEHFVYLIKGAIWWREHTMLPNTVADPGFSPGGGAPTPKNAIIFQFFAENCMKMKEFGPPGGGARPWRPPLDPPMKYQIHVCTIIIAEQKMTENNFWLNISTVTESIHNLEL